MKTDKDLRFRRSNFFPGLKASPIFWNQNEDYHFNKEILYNKLFNGYGIVPNYLSSFAVETDKTKGGLLTLVINPGLAIDGFGRPIFLYEPYMMILDIKKFDLPCTAYIVARYNEEMEDFYKNPENHDYQGYQHKKESCVIEVLDSLLDPDTYVELSRVYLDNSNGQIMKISDASNFSAPGPNELDARFVSWTRTIKKGVSKHFLQYLIQVLSDTEQSMGVCYSSIPIPAFLNLQTIVMTSKIILQTSGIFFDDVLNMLSPLYSVDYQVVYDIAEYERSHKDMNRSLVIEENYTKAREDVLVLGDMIKNYNGTYEELNKIIALHSGIVSHIEDVIVSEEVSINDMKIVSFDMPHVLLFNERHYTMIDSIDMSKKESIQGHDVRFIGCSYPTTSNESFRYPDGTMVNDIVKRWIGGEMKFKINNVVKGNDLLIIRRTDVYNGNYVVNVVLNDDDTKEMEIDCRDVKSRWRNYYVEFEGTLLNDYIPEVSFSIGSSGRDNCGTVWIYQAL